MLGDFRGKRMAVALEGSADWRHPREKPADRGGLGRQVAR